MSAKDITIKDRENAGRKRGLIKSSQKALFSQSAKQASLHMCQARENSNFPSRIGNKVSIVDEIRRPLRSGIKRTVTHNRYTRT